jgi:D-alanyl-D-alanine carboxypeptidase
MNSVASAMRQETAPGSVPAPDLFDQAPPALRQLLAELGITSAVLAGRPLRLHAEATRLETADGSARAPGEPPWQLAPEAAQAWRAMQAAAASDGVVLLLASAFRSVARQAALIRQRLDAGEPVAQVLHSIAPPGTSEHHTGRAVDIATPGHEDLDESFETSAAFAWLVQHAARFGFAMSYPRGNTCGYTFEPWHWCHAGDAPGPER